MIDKLFINMLKMSYRYHSKMYMRYSDKYWKCVERDRIQLSDRYLNKAVKHNKQCGVIDTLIYSLHKEDI